MGIGYQKLTPGICAHPMADKPKKKYNFTRRNFMKKVVVVLFLFLSIAGTSFGQRLEAGVFGGGSYYLGDINPGTHFQSIQPAVGVLARYNLNTRWAVRLMGNYGKVVADDAVSAYRTDRGLKFESNITEVGTVVECNFLDYFIGSELTYVTPYIFGGVSAFLFKPQADGVNLQELGTEGQNEGFDGRDKYGLTQLSFPFGIGVKYSVNRSLGLGLEWGLRKTTTDYLDDISSTYYLDGTAINPDNTAQVLSDPTLDHLPNQQRGNADTNDWYSFVGVTVTFKINLGDKNRCEYL